MPALLDRTLFWNPVHGIHGAKKKQRRYDCQRTKQSRQSHFLEWRICRRACTKTSLTHFDHAQGKNARQQVHRPLVPACRRRSDALHCLNSQNSATRQHSLAAMAAFTVPINRQSLFRPWDVPNNPALFARSQKHDLFPHGHIILQLHRQSLLLDLFNPLHGRFADYLPTKNWFLLLSRRRCPNLHPNSYHQHLSRIRWDNGRITALWKDGKNAYEHSYGKEGHQ